ncbi:hypothetical protein [Pedobacter aquatilis]|uniref:hypothetical protein n=1 Tax=Pedobacter aquatilis TaxID=351343 RepID=UPI002930B9E0|nr:hypothetical protein [Pedobacter aquatilis]
MKKFFLLATFLALLNYSYAQQLIFDREHFSIVNQNGLARLSAELALQSSYNRIKADLDDIEINIGSLILTEQLIFSSLTQVDQGLKSGLMIQDISQLLDEIYQQSSELVSYASSRPELLLFAERFSKQLKTRGVNLLTQVFDHILAEKADLLMNAEKRDALLRKIALELRLIRSLVFSMRKSMFWAAQRSLISQVNPFKDFLNIDKRMVDQIISHYKTLKK